MKFREFICNNFSFLDIRLWDSLNNCFKLLPTYLPQLILAQRHLGLFSPGVVIIAHFLVAGGTGAAHLVAVAHLVVELLGFVGLQFLGVGQLGGNVLAGGAGFGGQHPLAIFGAAGEGHEQPVAALADGDRQVLGAHLYKFQKEQRGQRIACVECGGRNAAFWLSAGRLWRVWISMLSSSL